MSAALSLSQLDCRVLHRIQQAFPLAEDPYGRLAAELRLARTTVHRAVCGLRTSGIIRRIGATFAPAALGYVSALVAVRVAPAALEAAAARAGAFPEVTHNYERDADLSLWFTAIARSPERLAEILAAVQAVPGVGEVHSLPALRTFKIRVHFPFVSETDPRPVGSASPAPAADPIPELAPPPATLDALDRRLIARSCGDLGAALAPFAEWAAELGTGEGELLSRLRGYLARGQMRRFGAVLRHREAGVLGNAMCAWALPDDALERAGRLLAACAAVSHCYARPRLPGWPYSLYAMVHGAGRDACRATAESCAAALGADAWRILFSMREFKKSSMVYCGETEAPGPVA